LGMRGQISLDLVLTVLVLGAFLQILMGLGADLVQGQASASLNHQARALLGDVEGRLMAGQGVGPSLSLEGTLPRLRDPETGKELACEVKAKGTRLELWAEGKTRAEQTLALPVEEGAWKCGEKMGLGAGNA